MAPRKFLEVPSRQFRHRLVVHVIKNAVRTSGRRIADHPRAACWVHKTANVLNKLPKSHNRS